MAVLSMIFVGACIFAIGMLVGYNMFKTGRLLDYKFRIFNNGKEQLYLAHKIVTECWVDGLAEFTVVDLKKVSNV